MAATTRLQEFLDTMSADLDRTVKFWLTHSHDTHNGGFFSCLSKDGKVYDTTKYGWMQCRQVWMYARLYNEVERFQRSDILHAAEKGAEFLIAYIKDPETWKCYFSVTQDGRPIKVQRTIFCECFYLLAMSEMARATHNDMYKQEAIGMMEKIVHWVKVDDTDLGRPKLSGMEPTNSMAVPLMLAWLINQLETMDESLSSKYEELLDWCIKQLLAHIQRDGSYILENVTPDGAEIQGSAGRLTLPGHAIECGWFLLEMARARQDKSLAKKAIEHFIVNPFLHGWDKVHGGLLYFLDADGHSPIQLEWNMKLWWAHNEAMIGFLMAYKETEDEAHLERFAQVFDYCYTHKHFVDPEHGEWFGYLNQRGEINNDFKAGPFKGCFHVPRALMMCERMLKELLAANHLAAFITSHQ